MVLAKKDMGGEHLGADGESMKA